MVNERIIRGRDSGQATIGGVRSKPTRVQRPAKEREGLIPTRYGSAISHAISAARTSTGATSVSSGPVMVTLVFLNTTVITLAHQGAPKSR
jgi:hypothetical protein